MCGRKLRCGRRFTPRARRRRRCSIRTRERMCRCIARRAWTARTWRQGVELRAPVMERDFTPGWLTHHFDRALRHTIEPEAHYQFVSGIDNFRNILRFDPTDLASDTNEIEYSVTQRFYLKDPASEAVRQSAAAAGGLWAGVSAGRVSRLLEHRHDRVADLDAGAEAVLRSELRRRADGQPAQRAGDHAGSDRGVVSFHPAGLFAADLAVGAAHQSHARLSDGTRTTTSRPAG